MENIFSYTHELSHSAFWAWCISSLKKEDGVEDNNYKSLNKLANYFLKLIAVSRETICEVRTEVGYKGDRYDICIITGSVEESDLIVIETKLKASIGGQSRYKKNLDRFRQNYKMIKQKFGKSYNIKRKPKLVLLDIECCNRFEKPVGWEYVDGRQLLILLNKLNIIPKREQGKFIELYKNWLTNNSSYWTGTQKAPGRTKVILDEIYQKGKWLSKPEYHNNWGWNSYIEMKGINCIQKVGVIHDESSRSISIDFYFADTKRQAEDLYREENSKLVNKLKELISKTRWDAFTNFHFGAMQSGIHFCKQDDNKKQVIKYIDYFRKNINKMKSGKKKEVIRIVENLKNRGIIWYDKRSLKNELGVYKSNNPKFYISIRPGFCLSYKYKCEEAARLDCENRLSKDIAANIRKVLEILQEYHNNSQ